MIYKTVVPDASHLGQTPVEILKISSKGLDKTASMQKRASAFSDVIAELKPMQKKAYLHVITTGAYEYYGSQRNADAFNQDYMTITASQPKDPMKKTAKLDGGLLKYHDKSYMHGAKVYQEHQTESQGGKPSGIVKAAKYNKDMHRGQLLIEVDADLWRDRLNKRASGQDIYLSIGCDVKRDLCSVCLNQAHTLKQHCDHVTLHKNALYEDGNRACMFNDAPQFYDISGVNVPADPIAFVLSKVASGQPAEPIVKVARYVTGTRAPVSLSKAAAALSKLSNIQKQIICKTCDDPLFMDNDEAVQDFLSAVEKYPADEIVSGCNRKGILLSPKMLFRIIGKESSNPELFKSYAEHCPICGRHLFQDMESDPMLGAVLNDGSFDSVLPQDLNLSSILQNFIPEFGMTRPAVNGRTIRIVIRMQPKDNSELEDVIKDSRDQNSDSSQESDSSSSETIQKTASTVAQEFRRTYARYVLGFAQQNSEDTCRLAVQKIARFE